MSQTPPRSPRLDRRSPFKHDSSADSDGNVLNDSGLDAVDGASPNRIMNMSAGMLQSSPAAASSPPPISKASPGTRPQSPSTPNTASPRPKSSPTTPQQQQSSPVGYSPRPHTPQSSPAARRRQVDSGGGTPEFRTPPSPQDRRTHSSGRPTDNLARPSIHAYETRKGVIHSTLDREPSNKDAKGPDVVNCVILVVVCLSIIIGGYLFYRLASNDDISVNETELMLDRFQQGIQSSKSVFENQSDKFWGTVQSQVKRIIRESRPVNPAIILFGSTGHLSDLTSTCLAHKVAQMVTEAFGSADYLSLDANDLASLSGDDGKLKLDEDITGAVMDGSRAVVLLGLQNIDGRAAMMFHSFCDNTNAPHTRLAYIFTVQVPAAEVKASLDEKQVEKYVEQRWSAAINQDNLPALLSRVSNNVIIINAENQATIQRHCRYY